MGVLRGALIILAIMVHASAAVAASAEPVELLTNMDYPPYISETVPGRGLHTEIIRESYRATGRELTIRVMPWKRITRELTEGRAVGSFSWAVNEERRQQFLISAPVFYSDAVIFTRLPGFQGVPDIASRAAAGKETTLCRPHGWTTPTAVTPYLEKGQLSILTPTTLRSCFELMLADRADYIDVPTLAAWHIFQSMIEEADDPKTVREAIHIVHPEESFGGTSHILFARSPEGARAQQQFAEGLSIIGQNGVLAEIVDRHLSLYPGIDRSVLFKGLRKVGLLPPAAKKN